ncbi:hypothetical protein, partial [Pseudonocardia yunnanensis]
MPYKFPLIDGQPVVRIPVAGPPPYNTLAVVRTTAGITSYDWADGNTDRRRQTVPTPLILAQYDPRRPEQQHVIHSSSATVRMMQISAEVEVFTDDNTDFQISIDAILPESRIDEHGRWWVTFDVAEEFTKVFAGAHAEITSWVLCYEPGPPGSSTTGELSTGSLTVGIHPTAMTNQLRQLATKLVAAGELAKAADANQAALDVMLAYVPPPD